MVFIDVRDWHIPKANLEILYICTVCSTSAGLGCLPFTIIFSILQGYQYTIVYCEGRTILYGNGKSVYYTVLTHFTNNNCYSILYY